MLLSLGAAPWFFYCLKQAALYPLPSSQLSFDWLPFIKVGGASSAVCLDIIKVQEFKEEKKNVRENKSNLMSELLATVIMCTNVYFIVFMFNVTIHL